MLSAILVLIAEGLSAAGTPNQKLLPFPNIFGHVQSFDIQACRRHFAVLYYFFLLSIQLGSSRRPGQYDRKYSFQLCMVVHSEYVILPLLDVSSRGLIDGSTTLEFDNGITKVPRMFFNLCPRLFSNRTELSWSGMMKKYFHQNARTPALQFVVHLTHP